MSTERTEITMDEAVSLLRRAVEEKGADHTESCVYFAEPGVPRCIVGHVLHYLGVEKTTEGPFAPMAIWEHFPDTTDPVVTVLRKAQAHQDNGGRWGDALEAALRFAAVAS